MITDKARQIIVLILNSFLFISSFVIVILGVTKGAGPGQVGAEMYGIGYLKAFTNLSNILSGLGAFVIAVFMIDNLINNRTGFPRWAVVFQYICACAVGLTFLTVVVFLAPMNALNGISYFTFFSNDMFFFHFLNPVLAAISVICLLNEHILTHREQLFALVPTVVYSVVYFFCVVVFKIWIDFYNFTFGGRYFMIPVSVFLMYGFTWIISWIYLKLHNRKVNTTR